ncbi:MAG TPA: 3-dehydroquinate synthase, partial [Pseudonocardia sp.]|nr:3-dehydroquinate synthase [Pseudonocardia sp.]
MTAGTSTRIRVASERPYDVTIGRGLADEVVLEPLAGATKAVIVHQPPLAGRADELVVALRRGGIEAHRAEIPDAEDGKT